MSEIDSTIPVGFRQIPGFPRYAIDENGTILSLCTNSGGSVVQWSNARQLKAAKNRYGYLVVDLCRDGKSHQKRVHVLVLTAFVGPCPEGMEARHLDENKLNNHVLNLAWGTALENYFDKVLHGTAVRGERQGSAKLTKDNVLEIRRRHTNGELLQALADEFRVDKGTVWKITVRRIWKHI